MEKYIKNVRDNLYNVVDELTEVKKLMQDFFIINDNVFNNENFGNVISNLKNQRKNIDNYIIPAIKRM